MQKIQKTIDGFGLIILENKCKVMYFGYYYETNLNKNGKLDESIIHKVIFFSVFSFSAFLVKKSWFTICFIVTRSVGFFCKHLSKKSLAYLLTYTYEGILICSFIIFINSSSLLILKGF
jgi:hypothetical protein